MSQEENFKTLWAEYSKLVLKELDRMNNNYESLRDHIEEKFKDINEKLSDVKSTEKTVQEFKVWQDKINEVWSTTQMKEAKDEIYKQKNRWTATIAILIFVQILIGLLGSLKNFING
jgi:SMC interacting uncharacterized protein involved in chromosome segregation